MAVSGMYDSPGEECNEAPYEEISHEIDNNFLSIKVLKDIGQIEAVHGNGNRAGTTPSNSVRVNCADDSGRICREECSKINIIPNRKPPPKKPQDEVFLLKCKKRVHADTLEHTLEMEIKAPRNYRPLPKLGPPPPIIEINPPTKSKSGKGEKKKNKKKKKIKK